jgi:hypothetical protein
MKNLVSLPLALIVAATAVSCGGGPKGDALTEPYRISFDISTIDRTAPFPTMSEMIEDIEYVKLEHVDSIPVGDIDRLTITDNALFVFDSDAGIFHYTRDGRFVRRVGHLGRGPGEYLGINGMHVDEEGGTIHAVSRDRVLRYELATGKFIGEAPFTEADGSPIMKGTRVGDLLPFSDNTVISSRGRAFTLTMETVHIDSYIAIDIPAARITCREPSRVYNAGNISETSVLLPQPLWYDSEGRVTVYENGADTMYVVGKDFSRTPRIVADFGSRKMNVPAILNVAAGMVMSAAKESGRYILFDLLDGMPFSQSGLERYIMSFDKTTGERRLAPKLDDFFFEGPVNDIDGGGGSTHMFCYDATMWYASYDAFRMIENLTPEHFEKVRPTVKYPDKLEKLQALVASLKEDDNPVIAIARVKR